ncbi:MAG: metal-sulfur cluster assembly factor [Firmicutes bacterium]|jgi:metal-sulfur cluster biosynthetic enzyme|nr:metal-sulfur cluster assembly factor [Bacillota bacterium]MCL5013049.1 metal-sulfur cluster assembly factor [Bacillota bacterium]
MSEITEETIQEALKDVIDPELGYNIVDLGLVYGITIRDNGVDVIMTMTTPGCPATNYIQEGAQERLLAVDGVKNANVNVVWSPPWDPSMMSDDAKQYFGFA